MEPDPFPWLSLSLAVALLAFVHLLEVAYTYVNRSEVRRSFDEDNQRTRQLEQLLHEGIHLFLALSLLKYLALLLIGATSAPIIFTTVNGWQNAFYVVLGWGLLALLQPFWRAFVLPRAEIVAVTLAPAIQLLTTLLRPLTVVIQRLNSLDEWQ